jgi:16S rRNA (guanine966-N2)-methyltransferase
VRVIAGSAKGRRLGAPPGRTTRPTGDRVREGLFSSLGPAVADAVVLDLFAGSGALAVEALSRGAREATLVDYDPRAVAVAERNLERAGFVGRARVLTREAMAFCRSPVGGPFTLVLADPPYAESSKRCLALLAGLADGDALTESATTVVQRGAGDELVADGAGQARTDQLSGAAPTGPAGSRRQILAFDRRRAYGDTDVWFLRAERVASR